MTHIQCPCGNISLQGGSILIGPGSRISCGTCGDLHEDGHTWSKTPTLLAPYPVEHEGHDYSDANRDSQVGPHCPTHFPGGRPAGTKDCECHGMQKDGTYRQSFGEMHPIRVCTCKLQGEGETVLAKHATDCHARTVARRARDHSDQAALDAIGGSLFKR